MSAIWTARVWAEFHGRNLTRSYRDVLLTLSTYRGRGGLCTPAHSTLANRVGCSVRTVQRALDMAKRLGLVSWTERRLRASWRWLRTSNAYRLGTPDDAVQLGMRPVFQRRATTGQNVRGEESLSKRGLLNEMLRQASALPDLLAARRAAFQMTAQ